MNPGFRYWPLLLAWIVVWSNPVHAAATDVAILPQDGRSLYTDAINSARQDIRIEICVLEDPDILSSLQAALRRGVKVRAIVDQRAYAANQAEQANLATYLTAAGGELHLSNPIFPRSFPKIILIDRREFLLGSACLDSTTFSAYRDFVLRRRSKIEFNDLARLFENDWAHSAPLGQLPPTYNPTPKIRSSSLIVAPVNAGERLVGLYRQARKTLDIYSELLGNPTLESELAAAVARGVRVRLISPIHVNNLPESVQATQIPVPESTQGGRCGGTCQRTRVRYPASLHACARRHHRRTPGLPGLDQSVAGFNHLQPRSRHDPLGSRVAAPVGRTIRARLSISHPSLLTCVALLMDMGAGNPPTLRG